MIQTSAEWRLHRAVFQLIMTTFGECTVDLFASRLNAQLDQFVSWRPDPNAIGTDALQLPWDKWKAYAFPPFCLISRCLRKIREDRASVVLVAPVWQSQPWYPTLLELLDLPLILPQNPELLMDPLDNPHPLVVADQLVLAAWKLSGNKQLQQEFQRKLPSYWPLDEAEARTQPMKVHEKSGIAGVLNSRLIHFRAPSSFS